MKKLTKIMTVVLCLGLLVGCETEVAEFESVSDAKATAEKEAEIVEKEEPKEEVKEEVVEELDILTIENSDELKRLLNTSLDDSEYVQFFNDNKYKKVEFDGAIDFVDLLENKKTRYSMVLRAGEYDENSIIGPTFIVEDVGGNDKGVRDVFLTGNAKVGTPVRIVAKIYGFDESAGAVKLKIESISLR